MISPGEEELYRNPSPVASSSSSSSSRGGSSSSSTPVNNSANGSSRSSSSGSVPNSHPSSSANSNQSSPRRQASAPNGPLTNLPSLAELGIPPLPVAGPFGFGPMGMNGNSNAIPQFLLGRNGTNASSDSIHGFQPFRQRVLVVEQYRGNQSPHHSRELSSPFDTPTKTTYRSLRRSRLVPLLTITGVPPCPTSIL